MLENINQDISKTYNTIPTSGRDSGDKNNTDDNDDMEPTRYNIHTN